MEEVGGIPVAGVSDGRAEASSAVRDRSQEHVKLLLPVGLNPPSLPASSSEVAAWLLRTEDLQIPVTREAYEALQELPRMKELLVPTDGSNVPASLSTLIRHEPGDIRSEEDTARLIGMFFEMVFGLLEKYSTSSLGMQLERNKAENRTQSSSQVLRDSKLRPDATGIAHQATLLLGEDKWASMMAAINDLKRKLNSLSTLHYGPVNFLLAYAAAGTQFKWFFLPQNCADQMVDLVGPATFNLCKADDRARFLLSIVQAYLLLRQMRNALPPVTRRLPLFGKYLKPDSSGSWVMALATAVHKHVPNFLEHVQAVHTSWAAVQEAYAAAAAAAAADRLAGLQRPCIVSVVGEAKLSRKSNNLDVQLQPVGLEPQFKSEQDVSAMTWAACRALAFLHSYGRGICLRDLRRENTVQLGDLEYCMIDLENAAFADQQLPFHGTVAVAVNGSVEYVNGFGSPFFELGVEFTGHEIFPIASNTKFFISVCTWLLHERGLLNIDDDVADYMDMRDFNRTGKWCPHLYAGLPEAGNRPPCEKITFRHLLGMASGIVSISNNYYNESDWQWQYVLDYRQMNWTYNDMTHPLLGQPYYDIKDAVAWLLDTPLESIPGEKYQYVNYNYQICQYVIEKLTKMPIGSFLRDNIMQPLGLTNTIADPSLGAYGVIKGLVSVPAYISLFTGGFNMLPGQPSDVIPYFSYEQSAYVSHLQNGTLSAKPYGQFVRYAKGAWYSGEMTFGFAGAGLLSNTEDMIKWFLTWSSNPEAIGISKATLRQMVQPIKDSKGNPVNPHFGQGMEVYLSSKKGTELGIDQAFYTGETGGFATDMSLFVNHANTSASDALAVFWNVVPNAPYPTSYNPCSIIADDNITYPLPEILCNYTQTAYEVTGGHLPTEHPYPLPLVGILHVRKTLQAIWGITQAGTAVGGQQSA
ncbi:hypothetical protein WJX72_004497 [[Myrmecia] bisecta]|uniref:Beta-lactamase-related domain-containing protein n=1 Tax=[Myrmecia] bisecta TaxID=41462 RepID=A0AAW1R6R5_9CHLO